MLQLKNITKQYKTGELTVDALKGISIEFRKSEFVSILGQSGCGKTTMLNIIGGLDRYTSGDLIINGKSTKTFKDADWDAYRNHSIGFVFQSYNLIPHQSVLANVELALTLSGVSKTERRRRAIDALTKVGLSDQMHKRPAEMSGGQMQRVAIARALVNNPDIILADEPTGALDTKTSVQIMEILKEISRDKLIIMVTHNPSLAEEYSTRIIKVVDGLVTDDSNPYKSSEVIEEVSNTKNNKSKKDKSNKKPSMSFFTALSLSFNNLRTKKGRTAMTSFAGSIGIIGIALILALSNGINAFIGDIQKDTLSSFPITIYEKDTDLSSLMSTLNSVSEEGMAFDHENDAVYANPLMFDLIHSMSSSQVKMNNLKPFKEYVDNRHNNGLGEHVSAVHYTYDVDLNIYSKTPDGKYTKSDITDLFGNFANASSADVMSSFQTYDVWAELLPGEPKADGEETSLINDVIYEQYDLVYGEWPDKLNEVVLIITENNEISDLALYALGYITKEEMTETIISAMKGDEDYSSEMRRIEYSEICDRTYKLILNPDYYEYNSSTGLYEDVSNREEIMKLKIENGLDIKISGIIRPNPDANVQSTTGSLGYTSALTEYIIEETLKTDLAMTQLKDENKNYDVFTGLPFVSENDTEPNTDEKKSSVLDYVENANNSQKAELYFKIMTTPSEEYIASTLKAYKESFFGAEEVTSEEYREKLAELLLNQEEMKGLDKETILSYISAYTDDELEEMMDGYLIDTIVTQYEEKAKAEIIASASAPSAEVLISIKSMLESQILSNPSMTKTLYITHTYSNSTALPTQSIMATVMALSEDEINSIFDSILAKQATEYYLANATPSEEEINSNVALMLDQYLQNADNDTYISIYDNYLPSGLSENTLDDNLKLIGVCDLSSPSAVSLYANTFEDKDVIAEFINDYNKTASEEDKINYTDYVAILMSSVTIIINAISYVLIAFVAISLVVSSIMIGIITNISVLERTKEIGILRAIGASKRDVSRVFNAETLIIGFAAGAIGILLTVILCYPITEIVQYFTGLDNINASLPPVAAVILIIISMALTAIAGLIPSRAAAKKDPVVALRSE